MAVTTSLGFEDHERDLVASMYWEAFGPKLNRVMGPDARGIAFIRAVLDPTHAICARSDRGDVVGIAGFKTYESALVNGTWADMVHHYGHIGAAWRSLLMSLLEVDTENNPVVCHCPRGTQPWLRRNAIGRDRYEPARACLVRTPRLYGPSRSKPRTFKTCVWVQICNANDAQYIWYLVKRA